MVYDEFPYGPAKGPGAIGRFLRFFVPNLSTYSRKTPIVVNNTLHSCLPDLYTTKLESFGGNREGPGPTWLGLITEASSSSGLAIVKPLP